MKKSKSLSIKEAIKQIFLKSIMNAEFKVWKEVIIKELRGHDKLWKKDLKEVNQSIVGATFNLIKEFFQNEPPILILPFPIFSSKYEGWQIITDKTKINSLMTTIAAERYQKNLGRLYRLLLKIQEEREVALKFKLLSPGKIVELMADEKKKRPEYKKIKPFTILPYSFNHKSDNEISALPSIAGKKCYSPLKEKNLSLKEALKISEATYAPAVRGKNMTMTLDGEAIGESQDFVLRGDYLHSDKWAIDFNGLYVYNDIAQKVFRSHVIKDAPSDISIMIVMPNDTTVVGTAILTSFEYAPPYESALNILGTLQGKGILKLSEIDQEAL